jgi:hypothetical protein
MFKYINTLETPVQKFGQTSVGGIFKRGILETFGWEFKGTQNYGFLGKHSPELAKSIEKATGRMGKFKAKTLGKGFRGLGLGFTLFSAYQGYKEGGIAGAAKETAIMTGYNIAFQAVKTAWSVGSSVPVLGAVAAAYGTYKFGQAAGKYGKRMESLEMGRPIIDNYGTIATLRQRSMQAIQNTHLNGRMAMGNEAFLIHGVMR